MRVNLKWSVLKYKRKSFSLLNRHKFNPNKSVLVICYCVTDCPSTHSSLKPTNTYYLTSFAGQESVCYLCGFSDPGGLSQNCNHGANRGYRCLKARMGEDLPQTQAVAVGRPLGSFLTAGWRHQYFASHRVALRIAGAFLRDKTRGRIIDRNVVWPRWQTLFGT